MISTEKDNPHIIYIVFPDIFKSYPFCPINTSIINNHHLFKKSSLRNGKIDKQQNILR